MIAHVLLLVYFATIQSTDAVLFPRTPKSLTHAARYARRNVLHSLWEDMRLAYAGLRLQQQQQAALSQPTLYCKNTGTGLTHPPSGNSDPGGGESEDGSSGSSTPNEPVCCFLISAIQARILRPARRRPGPVGTPPMAVLLPPRITLLGKLLRAMCVISPIANSNIIGIDVTC